jgi:hypothetical protein
MAEKVVGPDGLPPPLYAQPMLHWLANILSAQAFEKFSSIEDVYRLKPPGKEDFWILEWAPAKKNKPVFPAWSSTGPREKCRSPSSLGKQASAWAIRSGFLDGVGLHAPRRESLLKCNGKMSHLSIYNSTNRSSNRQRSLNWAGAEICRAEKR